MIPADEGQFTIYNGFHCNVHVNSSLGNNDIIGPTGSSNFKDTLIFDEEIVNITLTFDNSCGPNINYERLGTLDTTVTVSRGKVIIRRIFLFHD